MSIPTMLCNICHSEPPKYTCPQCSIQTCSLICFKRHKSQLSCSGFSDTTLGKRNKYISQTELSGADVQRDYNFLLHVDRKMALSKRKTEGSKILHTNKRRNGNKEGWIPIRGVKVMKVPFGMERSKANKSGGGSNRNRSYAWTVEWIWVDDHFNTKDKYLMYRCDESRKLGDSIPKVWMEIITQVNVSMENNTKIDRAKLEEPKNNKIVNKEVKLTADEVKPMIERNGIASDTLKDYSKMQKVEPIQVGKRLNDEIVNGELEKQPNTNPFKFYFFNREKDLLIEIPPDTRLSEAIRGRTVIEFPTLYVSVDGIEGKKVVLLGHENSDSESASDSDSDSSAESDSRSEDDSDDGSESESSEDSDEAPQESSTKPLIMESGS